MVDDKTLHEVDNRHPSVGHVTGIYRWVDKVESLQLINYGQRLMVGLTVPEPGVYLRWLAREREVQKGAPAPPQVKHGPLVTPLQPDDITVENYLTWVTAYGVLDASPPPPLFVTQSIALNADPSASAESPGYVTKTDTTLTVPAGYRAVRARGVVFATNSMPWLLTAPITPIDLTRVTFGIPGKISIGPVIVDTLPQTPSFSVDLRALHQRRPPVPRPQALRRSRYP